MSVVLNNNVFEEYGGYLPLELPIKQEYYSTSDCMEVVGLSSGRAAIWYATKQFLADKIYIPRFYCPTIYKNLITTTKLRIIEYSIDENLFPIIENYDPDTSIIILVNYFGILNKQIEKISNFFRNVIIDNAHSFFSCPILKEDVYSVYSCRKFFGVPDGGYVIGRSFPNHFVLSRETSSNRMSHLLGSIEFGTNSSYKKHLENENHIGVKHSLMSKLTQRLMSSIDYHFIKKQRIANYSVLHNELKSLQLMKDIPSEVAAYCYPLLLNRDYHQELVKERIYVPTLWNHLVNQYDEHTLEYKYTKFFHCLPIDQRYSPEDMIKLANKIKQVILNNK